MNTDKHRFAKVMVAAIAVLSLITGQALAQPCGGYEVTAIIQAPECPPFGFPPTIGTAISEPIDGGLPNVVGYYLSCAIGPNTAFVWIGNENKFTTLDFPFGTSQSQANGISDDGTRIVGTADVVGEGTRGFLFDGKELTIIPPANDGTFSDAQAVSLSRVAGTTSISNRPPFYHSAFLWQQGRMTIIDPTYGPKSAGRDVSESGAVVGWMGTGIGIDSHVFLWEDGVVTDLGLAPDTFAMSAKAINNVGQIATGGTFDEDHPEGFSSGGFIWEDAVWTFVGMLPGYDSMALKGLNDAGQAVGWTRAINSSSAPDTGFVWQDGLIRNLNDLIPPDTGLWITRAEGINGAGQITGRATSPSGIVAFVLTPVEPPLGDLTEDCEVGAADLIMLLGAWGGCGDCDECPADLDGNCVVGASDLLSLLANWS